MPDFDARNPNAADTAASTTTSTSHPSVAEQPVAVAAPAVDPSALRRPVVTAVRWGAVMAGVAVGLSVQLALTLLGIAAGFVTLNVGDGNAFGILPLVWAGVSMLVSAFVGGYVAARMSGLKRRADGLLHGAVSWAVTTILFAVLAASIGGALVGGVFNSMTQVAQVQAQAAEGKGLLGASMRELFGEMDVITRAQLRQYLENGERAAAIQLLESRGTMNARQAATVVDQALILAGTPEAAAPQNPSAPDALQSSGVAAWVVFGAVALGLVLGMSGGTLGAAGARRVDWSVARGAG